MNAPLVKLKGASAYRDKRWLVRDVDLEVSRGEIVTMIGPNGSGKSTTAKMALSIIKPDEGTVERPDNLKVSYVPQKLSIDWTMPLDVYRFMSLTAKLTAKQIEEALTATGALHLKKAEVRSLSGGEFQRVMLARAMARRPELLVLDEPVQGVDFAGEIAIYDLIQKIRDDLQCGILLISHDLHIVMAATDRVLCLNGHVCCQGTPTSVASSDAYKNLFGSRTNAALALYEHRHDHVHLPDGRVKHEDGTITDPYLNEDEHNHA